MAMEKGEERTETIGDAENVVTSKRDEALRLRDAGLTYNQIGQLLGLSKQRAWQILKAKKPKPQKPVLESKTMLRVSEVAQILGLHPNTVRRWSDQGLLKAIVITNRGDRRFQREDVERFIK